MRQTDTDIEREEWIVRKWLHVKYGRASFVVERIPENSHKYRAAIDYNVYEMINKQRSGVCLVEVKTAYNKHPFGAVLHEAKYYTGVYQSLALDLPFYFICLYDEQIYEWLVKDNGQPPIIWKSENSFLSYINTQGRMNIKNTDDDEPYVKLHWDEAEKYDFNYLCDPLIFTGTK